MTGPPIDEVHTVAYVGAGMMGCVNSLVAAVSGYDVVLNDASPTMLDSVADRHAGIGGFLVESGYCAAEALAAGLRRVSTVADLAHALAEADLVSESIFEDRDAKRTVHRRVDELALPHAILTTNTSALMVSDLEDVVARGDRFAALHSHLGSLLYDIVGGPRTTPETINVLRRFVVSLGGTPMVLRKEHPGYVFNSINGQVMLMAVRLVLDGHATIEQVDRAWMADRGAPMGPFGMMDLFGLDLMADSWSRPTEEVRRNALRERIGPFLAEYLTAGRLGQKSGGGFYDYPDPAYRTPGFLAAEPMSPVASDALRTAMIGAAVAVVANDVADPDDVDMAWSAATGQSIGPFAVLAREGAGAFVAVLGEQVDRGLVAPHNAASVRAAVYR